jgi:DNA-binding NarL/FixJ family response regulator
VIDALQAMMSPTSQLSHKESQAEDSLEAEIVEKCRSIGRKIEMLIIDDESVYRSSVASFVGEHSKLKDHLILDQAIDSDEALLRAKNKKYDLIVSDVDLGEGSLNGFELTQELRETSGSNSLIAIHSNRICPSDHQASISSGANLFIPKPMGREQFLRLILQSVPGLKTTPPPTYKGTTLDTQNGSQPEVMS